ncbi:hypothetical protein [Nocardia suismassiliense]|uniref:hypothetical protein n=1 Tax=Nocardia suismassiliense TaxID=2077092 RepID=UPI000D1E56BD|nr:hypothetical protein [Nocardia suismassiliense]
MQTAKQAVAVTQAYEKQKLSFITELHTDPRIAAAIDILTPWIRDASDADLDRLAVASAFPEGRASVEYLRDLLFAAEGVREWQAHRVVYRVHPELVAGLAETDRGTPIPCEVFRRLPHPNPFVVFPVPLPAPRSSESPPMTKSPVYVGMLVTGRTKAFELCSTADPAVHYLNAALIGRLHFAGQEPDFQEYNIRIPCVSQRFTVEEMIMTNRLAFEAIELTAVMHQLEVDAYRLGVSLLLYLCSSRGDLSAPTELVPGIKKRRKQTALNTIVDMGFDIGPKLLAARKTATEQAGASGKAVRAHIRRAHWHTYWTGPRDQQVAEVRWLHPVLVHPQDRDATRSIVIDTGHGGIDSQPASSAEEGTS